MKMNSRFGRQAIQSARTLALAVGLAAFTNGSVHAAETNNVAETNTNAPAPLTQQQMFEGGTESYHNWIELSAGGFLTSGNAAQAQQLQRMKGPAFGGIQDLHLEQQVATNLMLTLDGRSIFDEHDYNVGLKLEHPELWYLKVNFQNFRTWYNDDGGFYPPTKVQYSRSDDALALDRGEVSFEGGLTLKKGPKITLKYTHRYRDGDKSSTDWGPVHPDPSDSTAVRGIYPAFYNIDEKADIFQIDVTQHIKKTDFGGGIRFETGDLNNTRNTTLFQGEPVQRNVTDRQGSSYDLFSAHAFSETWIKPKLFFSSGFMFENLDSSFSGNRIYGDDFDVGYAPNALNGLGYYDLNGGAHQQEYVLNLNLMAVPFTNFTIVPSIRVQKEDWNADSHGVGTLGTVAEPFDAQSHGESLDVRERIDVRYTGVTNWVFYGGGEWTEGQGNLHEKGGLSQINGIGVPPILRDTEDSRLFQKYSLGMRWYPLRTVTLDLGSYYKNNQYDYEHDTDSTANDSTSGNRYPAYLVMQDFETWDSNFRLTFRPRQNVTLVTRYEYQLSTIDTRPAGSSGLKEVESSKMTSHIIGQNVSWVPWNRLSLQAGINYVLSDTTTPTSDFTRAVLDAQNNYWTLNFSSSVVLDDKTDLLLSYFYYQADNYKNNIDAGLPLGAGASEHGVTATLTRKLSKNVRLNLKYGYFNYDDATSGGHNNYQAHVIFSSLQYRF